MPDGLDIVKLSAARLWAAHRFPYFATGLFGMVLVPTPGLETFAIDDRWRLYADPAVVNEWSVPELGAVLVHELSHVLRDHGRRAVEAGVGEGQFEAWNIAADAEINDDLLAAGLKLPGTPPTPARYGWPDAGLAESYFQLLRRMQQVPSASELSDQESTDPNSDSAAIVERPTPECGSGSHGRRRPWDQPGSELPGVEPAEAELLRRLVARDVAEHGRRSGDIPAGWLRWSELTLRPVLDWRRVLAAQIRLGLHRAAGRADFTFTRRSRRASVAGDVILPGTFRPAPELAVVVDTSGSMSEADLAGALSEVDGILSRTGLAARRAPILACDEAVGAVTVATRASDVQLVGGGGTDMGVGIAAAARLRPRPQVVVVLTDGGTPWPASPPPGISVVVGLIGPDAHDLCDRVPHWASAVAIEESA